MLPDDTSGRTLALLFLNIAVTKKRIARKKVFEINCLKRKAFDFNYFKAFILWHKTPELSVSGVIIF